MRKQIIRMKWLIIFICILVPGVILAQNPGGFDDDVTDNPVPLDGGVSLLIAAGIGYGIKKVRDQRKTNYTAKR